jgi:uncharacterized integral membrane protein (TIGR00697 family)
MVGEWIGIAKLLLEMLFIVFAVLMFGKNGSVINAMTAMALACMISISVVGGQMMTVFGFHTNIGNAQYAGVILAHAVIAERYGIRHAQESVFVTFVTLILLFFPLTQLSRFYPIMPDNASYAGHLHFVLNISARVIVASFVAYYAVNWTFVWLYDRWRNRSVWIKYVANAVLAQALDSVLFFSIAFIGILDNRILIEVAVTGFVVKSAMAVMSAPLMMWVTARTRRTHPI